MSDEFTQENGLNENGSGDYSRPEDYSSPQNNAGQGYYDAAGDGQQPYYGTQTESRQNMGSSQGSYQRDYSGQEYHGTYQQQYDYNNQAYYAQASAQGGESIGFGVASLVLGILSLLTFACCVNYILAILSIIFGIIQIVKNGKKGLAVGGIVTSVLSILIATVLWIFGFYLSGKAVDGMDDNPFQEYLEEYSEQSSQL